MLRTVLYPVLIVTGMLLINRGASMWLVSLGIGLVAIGVVRITMLIIDGAD